LKLDEQRRKEFEWSVHSISNQAIQKSVRNEQSLEKFMAAFLTIMTPEQKEIMERQLPQMKDILQQPLPSQVIKTTTDSSLSLEEKKNN
jgi:hypothetical protein